MLVTTLYAATAAILISSAAVAQAESCSNATEWVTIWGSMPQLTEPQNLPPAPFNQTGLVFEDSTIRQTILVSLDADSIRLELSNAFGGSDLPITGATVAMPTNQTAGISGINTHTLQKLTFSGSESFIVPNGAVVFSDPIDFPVSAQSIISISIYLEQGQTTNSITSHPGSRTTSYLTSGNHIEDGNLGDIVAIDHWYFISAVEGRVKAGSSAIAIVGDSITDGRGSTTNNNDRWPDQLLTRLRNHPDTKDIAVVNQAAGGNRVLADILGPNALGRIDRDVLAQSGIKYAIVYEGVNDIGVAATDEATQRSIGDRLIQAYDQMILRMHRHGIAVFGATITPFSGPGQDYTDPNRENTRQRVNRWIRDSGRFDALIDFDKAVRDPDQPDQLAEEYNSGDYLHLNPVGYKVLAEAVDITLFDASSTSVPRESDKRSC